MPIKHAFTSPKADDPDATLIRPSNWNANHDLSTLVASDVTDFNEAAQDAVGNILTDSTTIDFTYSDAGNTITAAAIVQQSITSDASGIKLSGDTASPGATKVYGTDAGGARGWQTPSAGAATPSDFQPTIVSGIYYPVSWASQLGTSGAIDINVMYACPGWFSTTNTWTKIAMQVTSLQAAKNVRLGIYANNASNLPGALILDSGNISTAATGTISATISQSLTANTLYWFACLTDANTAQFINEDASNTRPAWVTGLQSISGAFNATYYNSHNQTMGALPDPFGAITSSGGANMISIFLQK